MGFAILDLFSWPHSGQISIRVCFRLFFMGKKKVNKKRKVLAYCCILQRSVLFTRFILANQCADLPVGVISKHACC